jgi:hypothetical protein
MVYTVQHDFAGREDRLFIRTNDVGDGRDELQVPAM